MASLVQTFQADILNPEKRVIDLLRMAKLISVKLGLPDVEAWIQAELDGYEDRELPAYRRISGRLQVRNPALERVLHF